MTVSMMSVDLYNYICIHDVKTVMKMKTIKMISCILSRPTVETLMIVRVTESTVTIGENQDKGRC